MSNTQDIDPLPDYNALRKAGKIPGSTEEFTRLFWSLQGPLSTAIYVMDGQWNVDGPREPYFRQTLSGTSWRPASQVAFSKMNVSSITVGVRELKWWQTDWDDHHRHAEDEGEDGQAIFGDEDEDGYRELLQCCGDKRPPPGPLLVVRASEKPYVTIHNYVSVVHPWLLGLRGDILQAMNVWDDPEPLPSDTQLMVNLDAPEDLSIMLTERWFQKKKGGQRLYSTLGSKLPPPAPEA